MPVPSPFLHPFTPPRKDKFLTVAGGKDAVVWDDARKEYIDGMASLWYVNVGHGRAEMAEAIATQAKRLAAYVPAARHHRRPDRSYGGGNAQGALVQYQANRVRGGER